MRVVEVVLLGVKDWVAVVVVALGMGMPRVVVVAVEVLGMVVGV